MKDFTSFFICVILIAILYIHFENKVKEAIEEAASNGGLNEKKIDDLILNNWPRGEKIAHKDIKMRTFISQEKGRKQLVSHVYDISYGVVEPGESLVVIDDSIVRGTTLRESLQPTFDGLKELFTPDLKGGPEPLTRDQNTANMENMNLAALDVGRDDDIFTGPAVQTGFTAPTNVSTLPSANRNFERIFALPKGTPPISPNILGNYLVNDPGGFLRMANLPVSTTRGFAEGGIASLQDPNYNLLMEASDFSL
mgnify:CR=1 FL=1